MELGQIYAILGASMAVILAGIGSVVGVSMAGQSGAGVVADDPDKFGKVLLLQALPATQGIYGLLIGFIVMTKINIFGVMETISNEAGLQILGACLPIAIVGLISAIYQGRVASASIVMVGKRPETSGKGITLTVMVETYAVLALLASFLLVNGIQL